LAGVGDCPAAACVVVASRLERVAGDDDVVQPGEAVAAGGADQRGGGVAQLAGVVVTVGEYGEDPAGPQELPPGHLCEPVRLVWLDDGEDHGSGARLTGCGVAVGFGGVRGAGQGV
jgi:hypothetical protein